LSKGNGSQSSKVRKTLQKQKVFKSPAPEVMDENPLSQVAVNNLSSSRTEVCGSGRSMGEDAVSNPGGPHTTQVPTAKSWSPIWYAQRL
jgi:hypothetical protein